MNAEKKAQEVMAWLFDHCIKLEFDCTHASAEDQISDILRKKEKP
jgi:hypothetical protein